MQDYIIYTDGCSLGNPGPGGWGAVIIAGGNIRELSGGYRLTTNNRMELLAAIEALNAIEANATAVIYSDSRLLVDGINKNWLFSWEKKNWKKSDNKPVLNKDLWLEILKLARTRNVKFVWVEAHCGITYNERCDVLAKKAAEIAGNKIDLAYEDSKSETNLFSDAGNETSPEKVISRKIGDNINLSIRLDGNIRFSLIQKYQTVEFGKETLMELVKSMKEFDNEN